MKIIDHASYYCATEGTCVDGGKRCTTREIPDEKSDVSVVVNSNSFTRPNDYTSLVVEPGHVYETPNHEGEIVVITANPDDPLTWLVWGGDKMQWVVAAWHVENNYWTRTGAPLWDREELAALRPVVRALSAHARVDEIRTLTKVTSNAGALDALRVIWRNVVVLPVQIVDACATAWLKLRQAT